MQKICKRCSGTIFTGKRQRCQNCSRLDKLVAKHGITFKEAQERPLRPTFSKTKDKEWLKTKEGTEWRRSTQLKYLYGISLESYNLMCKNQNNSCRICGTHKDNVTRKRLFVDHCHIIGGVRGLLCHACNTALGLFKDDTNVLQKAIKYLRSENESC